MSPHPVLTLVGMSGVGKSFQAERLSALGWTHHDVDRAIAARLSALVVPEIGEAPVTALGRWMGMPYAAAHFEREQAYLDLEQQVTREALSAATAEAAEGPQLIDTTGSVIYVDGALRGDLRRDSRIVYLRTPREAYAEMRARYLAEPKPVIWGDAWAPHEGESTTDSLARCYAELLAARDERYLALAHVVVDGRALWDGTGVDLQTLAG